MFYTYSQNNSGGNFVEDNDVTRFVIVEGDSASEANSRALEIGIYFDGVDDDIDCPCCGDRWYEQDDTDGTDSPTIYGESVESYRPSIDWTKHYAIVHYKDGNKAFYAIAKEAGEQA